MNEQGVFKWVIGNVDQFGTYQGGRAWEFDLADLCSMFLCYKDELDRLSLRGKGKKSEEEV